MFDEALQNQRILTQFFHINTCLKFQQTYWISDISFVFVCLLTDKFAKFNKKLKALKKAFRVTAHRFMLKKNTPKRIRNCCICHPSYSKIDNTILI